MTTEKAFTFQDFNAETQARLEWLAMSRGTHPIKDLAGNTVWVTPREAEKLRAGESVACQVS